MSAATSITIELKHIPGKLLHESPVHRRKAWGDLEELAGTIRQHGILEPMLVRPAKDGFELVFGHRRFRSGKLAKLEAYPCMVRELTDEQAVELMAVENLARKDLHPLEEAEGYEDLRKLGWPAERIADRVGKSVSYVYQRCKLLALIPEARKAFYEEKLLPAVAVYLARVPPSLQKEALEDLAADDWHGPATARQAFEEIERRYMLRLADAPFDRADATLVPAAGSCKDCPKRTGNQKELFADVKSADVCTDPTCFEAKKVAHGKRRLALAAEKGQKVLEGKEAQTAASSSAYVDVERQDHERAKSPKFGQLIKGKAVETVLALKPDGELVELVKRADVDKVAPKKKDRSVERYEAEGQKRKEVSAKKRVATLALLGAVVEKAEKVEPTKAFWSLLARLLVRMSSNDQQAGILKRRGIIEKQKAGPRGFDTEHQIRAHLEQLEPAAARGLAIELAAAQGAFAFGDWAGPELGKSLLEAAAFYKVDVARVKSKAIEDAKAKKVGKKAGKAAKP